MNDNDCIFCKIVSGDIPANKIYEDDDLLAFIDIAPVSDGHSLVIPKEHYEFLHDCPKDLAGKIFSKVSFLSKAVIKAMNSDSYNVLCNNGSNAGQVVKHVHFHIIPRKAGDAILKGWPSYSYENGKAQEIASIIKKEIKSN